MAFSTGIFNTTFNPAELNTRSFAGQILRRFPSGAAPMFALSSQSGKTKAKSSTHGYFSKTMSFVNTKLTAAALVGATTLAVPSSGMTKGMILHNPRTRENVRVAADPTNAGQITAVRGFGRVAAAAMNSGDTLIAVGTAFEEGSVRPTARRVSTVYVSNYTQIFRNAWALTDTARASLAEAGYSNITEDKRDCATFHATDIEATIIWGQPSMDTSGATPVHTTQGVLDALEQYCPENSNTAGATTNYDQLVAMVEPAFKYSTDMSNAKTRVGFCDNTAMRVMTQIARHTGQLQLSQGQTTFGMAYTKFIYYGGEINLITHPLFNGLTREGMLLIMDMSALKLAYLEGRDTKSEEYNTGGKIVENGVDAVGGSLTTEFAVELINPYSCAVIEGLTAGAA